MGTRKITPRKTVPLSQPNSNPSPNLNPGGNLLGGHSSGEQLSGHLKERFNLKHYVVLLKGLHLVTVVTKRCRT